MLYLLFSFKEHLSVITNDKIPPGVVKIRLSMLLPCCAHYSLGCTNAISFFKTILLIFQCHLPDLDFFCDFFSEFVR